MPSLRISIVFVTILFIPAFSALAQSSAGGSGGASGTLNPTQPPVPQGQPDPRFGRGHSVIPWEQYLQRKDALPQRSPISTGRPGVETVDWTAPGRAPVAGPLQPLALSPSASFEGIQQTNSAPPDPDMAVGPEDVIQVVNTSFARYSKTGQQTNLMTAQQWFTSILGTICPSGAQFCRFFDPTVRYDQLHGRFLILIGSEDLLTGQNFFVLSVSNGATYASGFKHWATDAAINGTTVAQIVLDFPQLGYDANAVYLTGNMFSFLNVLQYAKLRIYKKSELYNPATTTLTFRDIWDMKNEDGTKVTTLQPSLLRGQPGTGIAAGVLINASDATNTDYLSLWRINNPAGDAPTAVRTTIKGVWRYDYPAFFAQLNSLLRIDPGDSRVLKAVVRNGVLFTARNTGYVSDPTTVTYDRIDLATNRVTLQSRHINGTFFYPAFDVPASIGPANAIPNKLITGTATDATGAASFIGLTDVKAGESQYEGNARWGDYFGGSIDPVQGGLWVYGEYAKQRNAASGRWGTWAAYYPLATSPQFNDIVSSNPFYDFVNMLRLWSITSGCTATNYCPGDNVTRGQMAVFVVRAITGDNFTFPTAPFFNDVPATHPFFKYIQKMRELNITTGCSANSYCPDGNVSRGEMAVFLVRGKVRALQGDNFPFPATVAFADVPANHPFFAFVQKLKELGVTSGCSPTTFCPDGPVTREQMAAFISRSFLN